MAASPIDTAKKVYACFLGGDMEGFLAFMAPDVVFHLSPLCGGLHAGVDAIRAFLVKDAQEWKYSVYRPEAFMSSPDSNEACVFCHVEGTRVATGKTFSQDIVHRVQFTSDMKVQSLREWLSDPQSFAEASN